MRGILLFTDNGVKLFKLHTWANDVTWTAEKLYSYCNQEKDASALSRKIEGNSIIVDCSIKRGREWYKEKANFRNVNMISVLESKEEYREGLTLEKVRFYISLGLKYLYIEQI